jgi:hypothetical protein
MNVSNTGTGAELAGYEKVEDAALAGLISRR